MNEYVYATDEHKGHWLTGEEIVRCRDCQHYTHSSWHRCDLYSIAHEVEPNGYCAWGERKQEIMREEQEDDPED